MRWAVIFGVVAVVASAERAAAGERVVDPQAVVLAAAVGHGLGTALAVWWFTAKGGPRPNDWWVAPACAAVCVVLWAHLASPRVGRHP